MDTGAQPPPPSPSSDPVLSELRRRGLEPQYLRLFDAEGQARGDLPPGFAHLSDAAAGGADTPLARWLRALPPPRLAEVLRHEHMGKPRLPLTAAELEADFDLLPPASAATLAAEAAAAARAVRAAAAPTPSPPPKTQPPLLAAVAPEPGGSSSLSSSSSAAPSLRLRLAAVAPPPDPYAELSVAAAAALREEDAVLSTLLDGNALVAQLWGPALHSRFNTEILGRALDKLRTLRWEPWLLEMARHKYDASAAEAPPFEAWARDKARPAHWANPFLSKITEGNCEALGVPDYFKFVKKPMDLTRMQERLSKGGYEAPDAFFEDAQLVVRNCKVYNGPDVARRPPHVFPEPAAAGANFGPATIYGMAFDLDAEVAKLQAPVRACFEQLRRLERRRAVDSLLSAMREDLRLRFAGYLAPEFQARLRDATAEWAKRHGINVLK